MATNILASQTNHIVSGVRGDKEAASCSGVPGNGGFASAYIYVNTYITTLLDDEGYLWFANTSGHIIQDDMRDYLEGGYWYSYCLVDNEEFSITYQGSFREEYEGRYFQRSTFRTPDQPQDFTGETVYNVITNPATVAEAEAAGYWRSSITISDISSGTHTIDIWIAYPVVYGDATDPVTLDAVRFTFAAELLFAYYPFAVYLDGEWKSCNRADAGSFKYTSATNRESILNLENDEDNSSAFYYDGSSWVILPQVGST